MKNLTKRFCVLLALNCAQAVVLSAQTAAQPAHSPAAAASTPALPSADQVLKHYYEAIGGRAAWEKLHSRISKGTIEIPAMNNLSGTIEVHMKAPNSILLVINVGGAVIRQGFDGTTAWSDDPRNGLRVLSGEEMEEVKREANFYHALDLQKIYSKMTVTGTEKVGDRDAYVVEATPAAGGEPEKLYFDTQSGLEVRSISHRHTADGLAQFTANIEDYKELDGIKLPSRVEQSSAQNAFTIRFTDIQHNMDLADSQFAKPAAEPAPEPAPAADPPPQP
jgi:zinc protease